MRHGEVSVQSARYARCRTAPPSARAARHIAATPHTIPSHRNASFSDSSSLAGEPSSSSVCCCRALEALMAWHALTHTSDGKKTEKCVIPSARSRRLGRAQRGARAVLCCLHDTICSPPDSPSRCCFWDAFEARCMPPAHTVCLSMFLNAGQMGFLRRANRKHYSKIIGRRRRPPRS